MKQISFRAALKLLGVQDISLRKLGGTPVETTGFFTGTGLNPAPAIFSKAPFQCGQTYYVTYQERPLVGLGKVMYRTAKDRKDFTGGNNQWDFEAILANLGYKLK